MVSMLSSRRILRPITRLRRRLARGRVHFLNVPLAGPGRSSHQQTSAGAVALSGMIVNKIGMMDKEHKQSRQEDTDTVKVTHGSPWTTLHALADGNARFVTVVRSWWSEGFILCSTIPGADCFNFTK